jgi:hypothetical protein
MDTGGSGIGKAAGELMKEMQKAQAEMQKLEKQAGAGAPGQFQETMQAQQVGKVHHIETSQVNSATKAQNVLLQAKINANSPSVKVGEVGAAQRSQLATMLEQVVGGQDKMAGIMKMALSGRQFSPPELLAMQAGVYRFSQELELTSKVIEKATSGIKQTMNTQV